MSTLLSRKISSASYLLGYTYKEIEEETGISHGSIANIVSELEDGDLNIPGTSFAQMTCASYLLTLKRVV